MADYYTQAAFWVKLPDNALSWLQERIDTLQECQMVDTPITYSDEFSNEIIDFANKHFDEGGFIIGPDCKCYKDNTGMDNGLLIADDNGHINIEQTIKLLQLTLQHFNLPDVICFEWACTCNKNRPGGFGGGCVCISKDTSEWMNTSCETKQLRERVEKDLNS